MAEHDEHFQTLTVGRDNVHDLACVEIMTRGGTELEAFAVDGRGKGGAKRHAEGRCVLEIRVQKDTRQNIQTKEDDDVDDASPQRELFGLRTRNEFDDFF